MSYEIVKSVSITDKGVFYVSAPGGIQTARYRMRKHYGLSELLSRQGREAVEREILMMYFFGSFRGSGPYEQAVRRAIEFLGMDPIREWDKAFANPDYGQELSRLFHRFFAPIR